jgi:FAD/FMN-containing dehydrogenase
MAKHLGFLALLLASAAGVSSSTRSLNTNTLLAQEIGQLTDKSLSELGSLLNGQSIGLGHTTFDKVFGFSKDSAVTKRPAGDCKTYAGDLQWPDESVWSAFDFLLGSALLQVPPIASPCYSNWDNYDEALCASISEGFTDSHLHMDHPSSIMSPFYQGATCMPIKGAPGNCTLGGFPYYVVNATSVAQIQLSINLARNLDLRLVIKNTGHDFAGKSAGEGALSIWTHNLKGLEYIPKYSSSSSSYTGPAFKMGSGVQTSDLYAAAKKNGVTVVGGEGETVGVAGGYIQGGGHSPLGSVYGLGSDQALAFQVVTADGRFVTASEGENTDLFWALRGGGGGTFGVVTSVTVKAYPKIGVTVSNFTLTTGDHLDSETFWQAMRLFWDRFPDLADAGAYSYFRIYATGPDAFYFGMTPFFTPNMTVDEHNALLQPWIDCLSALNVSLTWVSRPTYYDDFYDAWAQAFPLETVGLDAGRIASRLFPRENWANTTLLNETWAAVKNTTENGFYFTGFNMKNELYPGNTEGSANPAWRDSVLHAITAVAWADPTSPAEILELSNSMTYGCMDQWRAVTPNSGSYLGEVRNSLISSLLFQSTCELNLLHISHKFLTRYQSTVRLF